MAKPLPGPNAARNTLAHRKGLLADRLRQKYTTFGLRSKRVFLVWSRWTGEERGEGDEEVIARVELLPTPRTSDVSGVSYRSYGIGVFPEGSIRVDQVSIVAYTEDMLRGLRIPEDRARPCGSGCGPARPLNAEPVNAIESEVLSDPRVDFWYEVVEDGRGDSTPARRRYRLLGMPNRDEQRFQWTLNLERADESLNRSGEPTPGPNIPKEPEPDLEDWDE